MFADVHVSAVVPKCYIGSIQWCFCCATESDYGKIETSPGDSTNHLRIQQSFAGRVDDIAFQIYTLFHV